ncbi:MAG: hypothetical protein ACKVW3_03520 [Phycisphaerales bacterium]
MSRFRWSLLIVGLAAAVIGSAYWLYYHQQVTLREQARERIADLGFNAYMQKQGLRADPPLSSLDWERYEEEARDMEAAGYYPHEAFGLSPNLSARQRRDWLAVTAFLGMTDKSFNKSMSTFRKAGESADLARRVATWSSAAAGLLLLPIIYRFAALALIRHFRGLAAEAKRV